MGGNNSNLVVEEAIKISCASHLPLSYRDDVIKYLTTWGLTTKDAKLIKTGGIPVYYHRAKMIQIISPIGPDEVNHNNYTTYGKKVIYVTKGKHVQYMRNNPFFIKDLISLDYTDHFAYDY